MKRQSNRMKLFARLSLAALILVSAAALYAIAPVEDATWHPAMATNAFSSPSLWVEPSLDLRAMGSRAVQDTPSLQRFRAAFSSQWEVRQDLRSDRPHLLQGAGVPAIPGRGNSLSAASLGLRPAEGISVGVVEKAVRGFLAAYPEVLRVNGFDLRLNRNTSIPYGKDNYLWTIELQQYHQGVPVEGANVFFRINHGNIVQFGANRVSEITIDATPAIAADKAFTAALAALTLEAEISKMVNAGTLKIFPVMDVRESYGELYRGPVGQGYQHLLVWEYFFQVKGSEDLLRLLVDAKTGAVLEYRNETVYATVQGQIYPVTNTNPLVTVPFPFANVTNGTAKITDASGNYTYSGGTATSTLNGRYISISDNCGAISLSDSSTGNLNFGGSGGTDCTTPGFGGAGNTHSARSGFYHLTNINRKAATFFPSNTWLNGTLTANMNINQTCNAFWNGSTVNFYRSGGGCSNTGEIAAVFLHEWGHGMDTNSGGAASENGSGEAVGDTFAFIETKDACIGENFLPGSPCANCRSSCTGVRDVAAFALGGISTIATPANVASNSGINCDRFTCPYLSQGIFPYQGPMGYEGHCESYIASTANWDLAQSLVTTHGSTAGWQRMDQIWYGSLTPSKSAYRVVSGGTCNPSATVDGCASTNWYTVFLPADDDDGNLANGTPNGCRIWSAFTAHGIACGSQPACSGGGGGNTPPAVSITAPANGSSFAQGASVSFSGTATDTQDGNLSANLAWTSSINGSIGSGASFSTSTLSVGTHTITASVTDTGGLNGSAQISITINAGSTALTNGVPVTGIAGATGSNTFFTLAVPAGATNLSFVTSGGPGDADLYVRFGSQPTTSTFDCQSIGSTNSESCSFATPSTGTYHVLIYGFATYSGLQLTGSYTAPGGPVTVTFTSVGAEDGRLWESTETSNVGGGGNSTDNTTASLRVGDFSDDTQYKTLVSFDTSSIPDTATITAATLRLKRGTVSGTSPFSTHGTCTVDISNGGFGASTAFAAGDFEAAATATGVASMSNATTNGTFSTGTLNAAGLAAISKTAKTQFKVYFTLDDNDDLGTDYMGFYSGEAATGNKPELVITYTP